jgi:small subunit ribosomal protein S4
LLILRLLENLKLRLIIMSRYRGPRLRIIRRLGELPGLTSKLPNRKNPPGQHGPTLAKKKQSSSEYKIRLLEKQKLRFNYGLNERQLVRYVRQSRRKKGSTGFYLMQLLEMRLDSIIFRLGICPTIPAARQFVNHHHVLVNNKKVNIPSFQCQPGDIITIQNKGKIKNLVEANLSNTQFSSIPAHIEFDKQKLKAEIKDFVNRDDLSFRANELLIVEYYSRIV